MKRLVWVATITILTAPGAFARLTGDMRGITIAVSRIALRAKKVKKSWTSPTLITQQ
jgi:hypothetical protein